MNVLEDGAATFARMLHAIDGAEHEIRLEIYTLSPVGVGRSFIEALSDAAGRGVHVRVMVDGWGTVHAAAVVATLRGAGCDARIHNPLLAGLLGHLRRNHRKLLLVDDEVMFVGGINLCDEFLGPRAWADLAVEIRGPACASLGRRLRHEGRPASDPSVRVLLSSLGGGRRLRRCYLKALGAARSRILLAHCYFLPDRHVMRSITAAARRGVDVTLLAAGRSDVPLARQATALLYRRLANAGVKVFEWDRSVLHSKLAVVDGERLLLGSFNLDPISLVNLEVMVDARDAPAARAAEAWMLRRLEDAHLIGGSDLEPGRVRRALGRLGWWGAERVRKALAGR